MAAASSAELRCASFHAIREHPSSVGGLDAAEPGVGLRHDDAEAAPGRSTGEAIRFDEHDVEARVREHVRRHRSGQSAADDDGISRVLPRNFGYDRRLVVRSAQYFAP